jgi:hypothetical protein
MARPLYAPRDHPHHHARRDARRPVSSAVTPETGRAGHALLGAPSPPCLPAGQSPGHARSSQTGPPRPEGPPDNSIADLDETVVTILAQLHEPTSGPETSTQSKHRPTTACARSASASARMPPASRLRVVCSQSRPVQQGMARASPAGPRQVVLTDDQPGTLQPTFFVHTLCLRSQQDSEMILILHVYTLESVSMKVINI